MAAKADLGKYTFRPTRKISRPCKFHTVCPKDVWFVLMNFHLFECFKLTPPGLPQRHAENFKKLKKKKVLIKKLHFWKGFLNRSSLKQLFSEIGSLQGFEFFFFRVVRKVYFPKSTLAFASCRFH